MTEGGRSAGAEALNLADPQTESIGRDLEERDQVAAQGVRAPRERISRRIAQQRAGERAEQTDGDAAD